MASPDRLHIPHTEQVYAALEGPEHYPLHENNGTFHEMVV